MKKKEEGDETLMTGWTWFRPLLEAELEAVGIRLNQSFPNVSFKIKKAGGISFNATLKLTKIDQKMVHNILHDYSMCLCTETNAFSRLNTPHRNLQCWYRYSWGYYRRSVYWCHSRQQKIHQVYLRRFWLIPLDKTDANVVCSVTTRLIKSVWRRSTV